MEKQSGGRKHVPGSVRVRLSEITSNESLLLLKSALFSCLLLALGFP